MRYSLISWRTSCNDFAQLSVGQRSLYLLILTYVIVTTFVVIMQPWLKTCTPLLSDRFKNPAYDDSPCRFTRTIDLLYLTVEECSFGRRIASSVVLGGIIG